MPVYVYRRQDGDLFETFQTMDDPPLTQCPDSGQPCRRVITGGRGFQLTRDFPSEQARTRKKLQKALEKNPLHTTMSDKDAAIRANSKANSEKARAYVQERGMDFKQSHVEIPKKRSPEQIEILKSLDKIDL